MEPVTVDDVLRELDRYDPYLADFGWALREILEMHTNHGDCRHPEPNEHIVCKAANRCNECQTLWPCRTIQAILKKKELG